MKSYNIIEAKKQLNQLISKGFKSFCPDCLSGLERYKDGKLFCPNERCTNNGIFDEIEEEK